MQRFNERLVVFCVLAGMVLGINATDAQAATVAHWDFNSTTASNGAFMPGNGSRADLDEDGAMDADDFRISVLDLSGNGNHLTAWTSEWMKWSTDSIAGDFSMQYGNSFPAASTDSSFNPHITGTDAEVITPATWTVEALFKCENLAPFCTIVGRDGCNVGGATNNAAAFYLSLRGKDLAVEYRDVDGAAHNLQVPVQLKPEYWYSVAAVSDGSILGLYLNGRLIGSLDLSITETDTALGLGYGTWSVARGMWANNHVDRFFGVIDEVAISDAALSPASFVIPRPYIGPDADGDGMGDEYENFFGLDSQNSGDAIENLDVDNLINFVESILGTDPREADTDTDGLFDDEDEDPLSRAVILWGNTDFTLGDSYSYTGPDWWLGAGKSGGIWSNNVCWMVPPYEQGMLYIDVERTLMSTNNMMLNLLHSDVAECLVYLDLGKTNGTVVVENLFGDIANGDGSEELGRYIIPFATYPEASRIVIDATAGSLPYKVWVATLYEDNDADGLDAAQEVQFGTLDTNPDSDGDSMTDFNEAIVEGTDPSNIDTDRDGFDDAHEIYGIGSSPFVPMWQEGGMPGVLQVERWDGIDGAELRTLTQKWGFGGRAHSCSLVSCTEYAPENTNAADDYGIRMRGTITPPVSGEFEFRLTGDNAAQVWLSDNESPYNRRLLLDLEHWTGLRDLSSTYSPAASAELTGSQPYYFEILMKERGGQEHVSLWWTMPGQSTPEIIGSNYLYSYVQPADDADADGLPDAWEAENGLDPDNGIGGGLRDADGDAYSDFIEYKLGLDPLQADVDGDGLSDGDEVTITLTDPLSTDTDSDGLPDLRTVLHIQGGDYVDHFNSHVGSTWVTDGTNAILSTPNLDPWIAYTITVDAAGIYRLSVDTSLLEDYGNMAHEVRLVVEIDGHEVDEMWMNHSADLPVYTGYTPWLSEGEHALKIIVHAAYWTFFDNTFRIHSVELGTVDGADNDASGIPDWMEAVLANGADSDGDGLSDEEEVLNLGTDPLVQDSDHDGLSDKAELDAGTNPLERDTDGDGVSDGDEVLHAFTNPLVADFGAGQLVLDLGASGFISSVCSWETSGDTVYALDRNGVLEYALSIASNGYYVLEVDVSEHNQSALESSFDLSVAMDDVLIDRATVQVEPGGSGLLRVWLPYADVGNHTLLLKWNNIHEGSSLQVNALRLLSFAGVDSDGNGLADWIDERLDKLTGEVVYMQGSTISPACIEGTSQNHALVGITSDFIPSNGVGQVSAVARGLGDGWYANAMLSPAVETVLQISAAPGVETDEMSVDWFETNVMTLQSNSTVTVRRNDALLLAAIPEGARPGTMVLYVDGPSCSTNLASLTETPIPYIFEEPGTYTINGLYSKSRGVHVNDTDPVNAYGYRNGTAANGVYNSGNTQTNEFTLVVEVIDASFGSDPYAVSGVTRSWACPNMPTNLIIEPDIGLSISGIPLEDGGLEFSLQLSGEQEKTVLARLAEDGPVVDRATVFPLEYEEGNYFRVVSTFPDGSSLVMYQVVLSSVPEDLMVEMSVITAGTTFVDGSLTMSLTADDFDASGVATYYLVRSAFVEPACHQVLLKQGDDLIDWY